MTAGREDVLKNPLDSFEHISGLKLHSNIYVMDRLAELPMEQLHRMLDENQLPSHSACPRIEVEFVLGSLIQQSWFQQTKGKVPARISQSAESYEQRYREIVSDLDKGETTVAKKRKSSKSGGKKNGRSFFVFTMEAGKADSYRDGKYVTKGEDGKLDDSSIGHIIRALVKERELTADELVKAVEKSGFKGSKKSYRADVLYQAKLLADKRVLKRRVEKEQPVAEAAD
jgi:hypothetical protein